jgi:hypothetical protein
MLKYQCNKCGETKDLMRATLEVVKGKVRTKEAKCKCGEYMQEIEKDFEGFTTNIIRTEPTLSKKGDKLWDGAKEKLLGERGINEPFD